MLLLQYILAEVEDKMQATAIKAVVTKINPEAARASHMPACFHGDISRQEAERLLAKCGMPGCHLLRRRNETSFALSLLGKEGCYVHSKIDRIDDVVAIDSTAVKELDRTSSMHDILKVVHRSECFSLKPS